MTGARTASPTYEDDRCLLSRLAGRALWSAVHGIVVTNFFGEEAPARQRTQQLLDLLLATFVDGVFASSD